MVHHCQIGNCVSSLECKSGNLKKYILKFDYSKEFPFIIFISFKFNKIYHFPTFSTKMTLGANGSTSFFTNFSMSIKAFFIGEIKTTFIAFDWVFWHTRKIYAISVTKMTTCNTIPSMRIGIDQGLAVITKISICLN